MNVLPPRLHVYTGELGLNLRGAHRERGSRLVRLYNEICLQPLRGFWTQIYACLSRSPSRVSLKFTFANLPRSDVISTNSSKSCAFLMLAQKTASRLSKDSMLGEVMTVSGSWFQWLTILKVKSHVWFCFTPWRSSRQQCCLLSLLLGPGHEGSPLDHAVHSWFVRFSHVSSLPSIARCWDVQLL